jgi:large subunit ribosomal protein L10
MSKALQQKISEEYQREFQPIIGACFLKYTGMTSELFREFRAHLRKNGLKCKVVKNNLFVRQVSEKNKKLDLSSVLSGPVCVVYGQSEDQSIASAKIVKDWIQQNKFPVVQGAYLNGEVLDAKQYGQLVDVGSREQVLSRLVSCIQMPMTKIARSINAVPQKLAGCLSSYEKKLGEGASS